MLLLRVLAFSQLSLTTRSHPALGLRRRIDFLKFEPPDRRKPGSVDLGRGGADGRRRVARGRGLGGREKLSALSAEPSMLHRFRSCSFTGAPCVTALSQSWKKENQKQ